MIMAYFPDGNLAEADFMDDVRHISAFGQILSGLEVLHSNGIVHRDLKPENFLIVRQPLFRVVIADFGLANVLPEHSLLHTFCGTLKYVAPEVTPQVGQGHGPPADIWSLGVIVFEWIYGIPETPDPPVDHRKKTVQPASWPDWMSSWCKKLLMRINMEDECVLIGLLSSMIEPGIEDRWTAEQCLEFGLLNAQLFKHRRADGLVICIDDETESDEPRSEASEVANDPVQASFRAVKEGDKGYVLPSTYKLAFFQAN